MSLVSKRKTVGDVSIEAISLVTVTLVALCCFLPFMYVFFVSFMPYAEYIEDPTRIIPHQFDITAYKQILDYQLIHTGYQVTSFITIVGTLLSVFLLVISAYPLSKKDLKGRRLILGMIMFTMFFNGGMIPNYLLIRDLQLTNTVWSLILPSCISAFNLILMKNFIYTSVPDSLEEAAKIDGANDLVILWRIILPLLTPAIATMVVFCAVGYWNNYFTAMIYVSDRKLWPLTLVLREIVVEDTSSVSPVTQMLNSASRSHIFTLKMAAIVVTILPILVLYPFMQKYFVTGISLGSVKE